MTRQIVITLLTLILSLPALSNHHDHGHGHDNEHTEGPCLKVKQACEAAGFEMGKHKEKKGLRKHCLKPILRGETVAGVTVAAEDIAACKEKREQQKKHLKAKHGKGKHQDAPQESPQTTN